MTQNHDHELTYRVCHSADLTDQERSALQDLLKQVYEGDFAPEDWDHALGGLHTLTLAHGKLVAHAAVVQRSVLVGEQPLRAGYLEAMGVHPEWQRQGVGRQLMRRVNAQISAAYDLGLLSPSDEGRALYSASGWTDWTGQLRCFTPQGVTPTPDEEVMVYGWSGHASLPLTCDYRSGDVW